MFELWIPITILAAFSQNLRSIYQKNLQEKMSNISSTYTRFLFGLPFVLIYFLFLNNFSSTTFQITNINITFLKYCFFGGISQIIATFLLIKIFKRRDCDECFKFESTMIYMPENFQICIWDNNQFQKIYYNDDKNHFNYEMSIGKYCLRDDYDDDEYYEYDI